MIKTFVVCILPLVFGYSAIRSSHLSVNESLLNRMPSDSSRYVVLTYNTSSYWVFSKGTPTGLSRAEVDSVKKLLKAAIIVHNQHTKLSDYQLRALGRYYLQFVPIINSAGEKEIWVNALCSVDHDQWKKEIIYVMDGGNCYFQVKVNLTKKTYYQLRVNGYA